MYKWWIQRRCMWVRGRAVGLCVLSDPTSLAFNIHTHTHSTSLTHSAEQRIYSEYARGAAPVCVFISRAVDARRAA